MARLYTVGWEIGSAASGMEGGSTSRNLTTGGGTPTVVSTGQRSGNFAGQCTNGQHYNFAGIGALDVSFFVRIYMSFSTVAPSSTSALIAPWASGPGFGFGELHMLTNGKLELVENGGGSLAQTASAMSANTWYRIEYGIRVNTAGSGHLATYIDGVPLYDGTASIGNTTFTEIDFGNLDANALVVTLDDAAVNDDTGSVQNNWPGPGKVVMLKPISDNSRTGFIAGGGGTTNLFDAVNNTPPVGVASTGTNTSQIGSANSNITDNYVANLGAYTTALGSGGGGLSANDTVRVVQAVGRIGNSATQARNVELTPVSNPAGSAATLSTPGTAGTEPTNWLGIRCAPIYNPSITPGSSPTVKVRKNTATTNNVMVDQMGYMVEYSPGSLVVPPRSVVRNTNLRR